MANLNRVFLIGNLTRDPELRYTPSGMAVTTIGLAVNNKYGKGADQKEETLFVDVSVWGKTAENCCEYLGKGSPVFIEGRLKYRAWEGQDGSKKSKIDVTATSVQFLPKGAGQGGAPRAATGSDEPPMDDYPPMDDDDVPF